MVRQRWCNACAAPVRSRFCRATVSLAELAGLPLVLREEGSKTRGKLEAGFAAAGLPLVAAIEAEGREAVREIVAAGGGVGFVSAAEFGADARLVQLAITGAGSADLSMDEALICLRERQSGKLVQAFFEIAAEAGGAPGR